MKRYGRYPDIALLVGRLLFSLVRITGLSNFYWDQHLKANGVFAERFAAPYEPGRGRGEE